MLVILIVFTVLATVLHIMSHLDCTWQACEDVTA